MWHKSPTILKGKINLVERQVLDEIIWNTDKKEPLGLYENSIMVKGKRVLESWNFVFVINDGYLEYKQPITKNIKAENTKREEKIVQNEWIWIKLNEFSYGLTKKVILILKNSL